MKRFLISLLGLALVVSVSAQNNNKEQKERKNPLAELSVEQKAQMITDRMVTAYGLNAEQRTKLLELNTRKLSQRPDMKDGKGQECKDQKNDCTAKKDKCDKKGCDKKDKKVKKNKKDKEFNNAPKGPQQPGKPGGPGEHKPGKPGKQGGFGYMRELKGIMTEDQFKAFMTDRVIERQLFNREGAPRNPKMNKRPEGKNQCEKPCDCKRD